MNGLDAFDSTEEEQDDSKQSASVSYIEISSEEHPAAYKVVSQGGPIRQFFRGKDASVSDFFADFIEALEPFFTEGDKVPLLQWIAPSEEEVQEYLDSREEE